MKNNLENGKSTPKLAIVHDWLVGGGAEKVVQELHKMYPDAPIYTSYATDEWRNKLDGKVITGYLQNWPFGKLRKFLPLLRQWWFARIDLSRFDIVLSSSGNGEAKFARAQNGAKHICYCHTPTHFYWRHYESYLKNPGFGPKPLVRFALKLLVGPLRKRDFEAAQKVDIFLANSTHIQSDIKQFYNRDSVVIHPPVETKRFQLKTHNSLLATHNSKLTARHGFVTVGRLVPQKKLQIIIAACNELQLPLTVIGKGPEYGNLQSIAGPTITFKTNVTDEQMPLQLAKAEAFIFAAEEDFGIAPVEAMSAGTPVIAYKAGGALDYVVPGVTGLFFAEQSVTALVSALQDFKSSDYTSRDIKNRAERFSSEHFKKNMQNIIESVLQ